METVETEAETGAVRKPWNAWGHQKLEGNEASSPKSVRVNTLIPDFQTPGLKENKFLLFYAA